MNIIYNPAVRLRARAIGEKLSTMRLYDATYAALAEVMGCDLWTADERFYNSAHHHLSYIKFVGTL